MSTTITIRTDEAFKRALQEHAASRGMTVSEMARQILEASITDEPVADRIQHVRGSLRLPQDPGDWRSSLRQRNWRR